jgi:hypothetical protein
MRAVTPLVTPSQRVVRNPEHFELELSGLRLALGEEASAPSATKTAA